MLFLGVDIGGTICAASLGELTAQQAQLLHRCPPRPTRGTFLPALLEQLMEDLHDCIRRAAGQEIGGIGISCGGPLDSRKGLILSPPNLPGWDNIPVAAFFSERLGLPAWLCNDANACALAEWKYGAGQGCSDLIFLTFGTGMGAGLILNGRLYTGASDMAGEAGHLRLYPFGPVGYGKMGSFEGFCSGGGIAQLARSMLLERLQTGEHPPICPDFSGLERITAQTIGDAAKAGDIDALKILALTGEQLGRGLSILIDLLNPEKIILGSIFARCYDELSDSAQRIIERETLAASRSACRVEAAKLAESVGDIAALTAAAYYSGIFA